MKWFKEKIWKISTLKYIAAFLIPLIFLMFINHSLDNDSYFVLAEGRYLVQNGIHFTDVLTMHDGLNIVVQNYGFAMVFYWIYSLFGAPGVYAMMLLLNIVVCYLIFKICKLISNKNINLSLLIMVIADCILSLVFVVTRAQMVSYVIFLALIYTLELYIKTGRVKPLLWIPLLSVLQINMHASLWWMIPIGIMVYIIDAIKKPKWHLEGYKMKQLLLIWLLAFLAGFINPYGLGAITYIFTSYGVPVITRLVNEMNPYAPFGGSFEIILYIAIVLVLVLCIFAKKYHVKARYILMFFGFLALGLNSQKGMSQFILVMYLPLALLYKDVKVEKVIDTKKGRNALMLWVGILAISIFVTESVLVLPKIKDGPEDAIIEAVDVMEEEGANSDSKIYVGYNNGGYVEYRGFKAYLDPRAEVFLKKNNGKEDILIEWDEMTNGQVGLKIFLEKYDFDYLMVDVFHDHTMYKMEDYNYKMIYNNEDAKVRVFKHLRNEE